MKRDAWSPNQYEKFKTERSQPFFDLMSLLTPVPDGRVMDLGCGTGELTLGLHRFCKARETIGLDMSVEMLSKTRGYAGHGVSFEQGNIEEWKAPQSFDVVFSNAALQWCSQHEELFLRLRESLKPHGQLAVQMPMNFDYPTHVIAAQMSGEEPWKSLLKNEPYDKEKSMLSLEAYARLLFRLGFRDQKVLVRLYGHTLESREGVIEWVKGTLLTHFQSRLSESDYEEFLSAFSDRLFSALPNDRPFFYPFKRILIWGRI
jgi:trans-aconitate 2-methyltransferase